MCLSLLDQVVWRRPGEDGRQNPASLYVRSLQILRDCWLCLGVCVCVCVFVCVCVSQRQKWQQYSYANMNYGCTCRDTHTHTKHLIAQKKVSPGLHCV